MASRTFRGVGIRRCSTQPLIPAQGAWSTSDVSWLKRDVLLFAISIGCQYPQEHRFLYELHPKFAAFPTYPLILPFKGTSQEVTDYIANQKPVEAPGAPRLDPRQILDAQRRLQVYRKLPTTSEGRHFVIKSRVAAVYDKGKAGSSVETEQILVDRETEKEYAKMVSTKFYVGQGNWGGQRGPKAVKYPPPTGRESQPDITTTVQLTPESAHLYRLNGDYNPLHATPEPGNRLGLGGTIMHGLHTWNATANVLLREFGNQEASALKEFEARFAAPVSPGSRLQVKMWKESGEEDGLTEIRFITMVGDLVVLDNGRAVISHAS